MRLDEMVFQWRLNWSYRPTQLDGFESSVADYYDCFIDWKENMELNLCPAGESDYLAAFIQNLRCDIRSRLESKGRPSTKRLSDAFYDAKLEECLIHMEEAFKDFEVETAVEKSVSANTGQKVLDVMPKPTSTAIGEELNVEAYSNEDLGASNEDLDNSEAYSLAFEALIWLFEEEQAPPSTEGELLGNEVGHLSASQANGVKGGRHMFEETPNSVFTVESFKMVEKSTEAILLGLKSMPEVVKVARRRNAKAVYSYGEIHVGMDSIPLIDCIPRVFDPGTLIINGDLGNVDMLIMPFPSFCMNKVLIQPSVIEAASSKSFTEIFGSNSTVLFSRWEPMGDAYQVFDEISKTFSMKSECIATQFIIFDVLPKQLSYEQTIEKGEMVVFMFDPGISSWHLMGRASISSSEILSSSVCKWVDKVLLCTFDPGGCCMYLVDAMNTSHLIVELGIELYKAWQSEIFVLGAVSTKALPSVSWFDVWTCSTFYNMDWGSWGTFSINACPYARVYWPNLALMNGGIILLLAWEEISCLHHMIEFCQDEIFLDVYTTADTIDQVVLDVTSKWLAKAVAKKISELQGLLEYFLQSSSMGAKLSWKSSRWDNSDVLGVISNIRIAIEAIGKAYTSKGLFGITLSKPRVVFDPVGGSLSLNWCAAIQYVGEMQDRGKFPVMVIRNFCVWMSFSSFYDHEESDLCGHKIVVFDSFVWDPGVILDFGYILGVKDAFEGTGKRMICRSIGDRIQ